MKLWARQLALGLLLTAAIPPAAVRAADSAQQILLDKANYWRLKDRPDLARDSLDKLLQLSPGQPDALYAYAVLELQQGNVADARTYLNRLQQSAPTDPRVAALQGAVAAGRIDSADLGEARKLGQNGEYGDAVKKYQQTFKGPAPASFGVEYYMTLAATPAGRDEARRGLEGLARNAPNDPAIKLALAKVQTYSAETRADGIAALARLSTTPGVGPDAVRAWHEALLWLGGTKQDRDFYRAYLAKYPEDTEVRQHLEDAPPATETADQGPSIDYQGYVALQQGSLGGAETQFAAALKLHPDDGDALAGLGMVRLRQGRFADARDLIGRAIKAVPARQPEWATAFDSATFWASVQDAKAAVAAANYPRAKSILTPLLAQKRPDNWGAELLLGEVEAKLGNKPGAEQAYRQALAAKPQNSDALIGLATVLTEEGKTAEAATVTSRLSVADRAKIGGGSSSPADALRGAAKEAAARGDTAGAREKFQQAIAADPKIPWARLDYARFLAGQGAAAQGFATMDPAATGNAPLSLYAAAIFDDEQHRSADALAKLDRIPAAARTPDMVKLRGDILVAGTTERAKMLAASGKGGEARDLLVALYHDTDTKPADRADIPRVLAGLGHNDAAAQLYREAASDKGPDAAKAAVDLAWLSLKDGNDAQASAIVAKIEAGGGAASAGPDLQKLKLALAVRATEALRKRGDSAEALARLTPLLKANPDDPGLLMAVGRAYGESGDRHQAVHYFETAYRQNPGNTDALAALIDGSIQAGEIDGARRYLDQAMTAHPSNARFYYLQAQLARAEGDTRGALRALETARTLNGQRPVTSGEGSSAPGSGNTTPPPGAAGDLSEAAGSSDPVAEMPPPLENTARSVGSADLGAPAKAPRAARMQLASLPSSAVSTGDLGSDIAPVIGTSAKRQQVAQLELNVPGPVPIAAYQQPAAPVANPDAVQPQDSLQLDIERSMAQIESENSPMVEGAFVYRGRVGTAGISQLNEVAAPIDGTFSPWMTGKMTVSVSPVWLDAGQLGSSSLAQFGANQYLSLVGASMVTPSEQSAFGVLGSLGYAYGPFSAKIGESAWGFPVTNWIGDIAYQPRFFGDELSVKLEALREPVTDSLLSYAGTRASLATANAISGNAFGNNQTWGGVTKTGGRVGVYFDDTNVGAFAQAGGAYLAGTNVAQNSEIDGIVGAYFRPWKTDYDAVRVGVNLNYFHFDKNLGFYSFGQGGYFSPANYVALTFPVEYQGRWNRWSYLAAVALGVQHFNSDSTPYFPNNPSAQAALATAEGSTSDSNVIYPGTHSTGLATDLRAQVEYAIDKDLAVGASAQYDNGNSYNEGIVKLYIRKTFSTPPPVTPILPGNPLPKPAQ